MARNTIDVLLNFTSDVSGAVRGSNQVDGAMSKVSKSVRAGAAAFGILATAISKVSYEAFAEFESAMANVNSVVLATSNELANMTEEVYQLTNSGLRSYASETAAALYNVRSAGIEAGQAMETTNVILKTSAATLADQGQVAKLVTGLMNSYGISAQKAGDLFVKTIQEGVTTGPELVSQMGRVAASAASAGIAVEDLFGAVAIATKNFQSTDAAVTGLTGIISSYTAASEGAKKAAQEKGIEFSGARLQALGLTGAMKELAVATGGNIDEFSKLIPSSEAARTALILTKNEAEDFTAQADSMKDSLGAVNSALDAQENSSTSSMNSFNIALNLATIQMGEAVSEGFNPLIDGATELLQAFNSLDKETRSGLLGGNLFKLLSDWTNGVSSLFDSASDSVERFEKKMEDLLSSAVVEDLKALYNLVERRLNPLSGVRDLAFKTVPDSFKASIEAGRRDTEITKEARDYEQTIKDRNKAAKDYKESLAEINRLQALPKLSNSQTEDLLNAYKKIRSSIDVTNKSYRTYTAVINGLQQQINNYKKESTKADGSSVLVPGKSDIDNQNKYNKAVEDAIPVVKELTDLEKLRAEALEEMFKDVPDFVSSTGTNTQDDSAGLAKYATDLAGMFAEVDAGLAKNKESAQELADTYNYNLHEQGVTTGQRFLHTIQNIAYTTDEEFAEVQNTIRATGNAMAEVFGGAVGDGIHEFFSDMTQAASAMASAMRGNFIEMGVVVAQEFGDFLGQTRELFNLMSEGTLNAKEASEEFIRAIPFMGGFLSTVVSSFNSLFGIKTEREIQASINRTRQMYADAKLEIERDIAVLQDDLIDFNDDRKSLAKNLYDDLTDLVEKYYGAELDGIDEVIDKEQIRINAAKENIKEYQKLLDGLKSQESRQKTSAQLESDKSAMRETLPSSFFRIDGISEFEFEQDVLREDLESQFARGDISLAKLNKKLKEQQVLSILYFEEIGKRISKDGEISNRETLKYQKRVNDAYEAYANLTEETERNSLQNLIEIEETEIQQSKDAIDREQEKADAIKEVQRNMIDSINVMYEEPANVFLSSMLNKTNEVRNMLSGLGSEVNAIFSNAEIRASEINRKATETEQKMSNLEKRSDRYTDEGMYIPTVQEDVSTFSSWKGKANQPKLPTPNKPTQAKSNTWVADNSNWFGKGGVLGFMNPVNWFANGGVTDGISIAGEAGPEAVFTGKQMKQVYEFVLNNTKGGGSGVTINIGSVVANNPQEFTNQLKKNMPVIQRELATSYRSR